jgi:hypothetical protein
MDVAYIGRARGVKSGAKNFHRCFYAEIGEPAMLMAYTKAIHFSVDVARLNRTNRG